ncbi:MAG: hypothetical protein QG657_5030 [Acidobacteriota bacterium]|nr:hypothetical protein [Acidobacteriota bacterium]
MIKIDYICGGIENITDFYGRREQIDEISHRLKSGQSVSIYGERKIGKTSLLKYLFQEGIKYVPLPDPSQVIILYETFAGKQDTPVEIFFQGLYEDLSRNMNFSVNHEKMDKNVFNKFIADSHYDGKHFIFFLDEIDAASENSAFDHNFFSFLRSLADKYKVQYIIASRKSLKQLIRENNVASPFNGLFSGNLFKLEIFSPEEAENFCRKLSHDAMAGDTIDPEIIVRLAGQHPFLIRLAFYHAVNLTIKSKNNRPNYDQLKSIFEKESYHAYFLDIWSHLESTERRLLKNISLNTLPDRLKLSEKEMIDDFKSKGLIYQDEKQNYIIFNGYFTQYIREWDIEAPGPSVGAIEPPDFDKEQFSEKLQKAEKISIPPGEQKEKGKALEELVTYLFSAYKPYFEVRTQVRSRTSALDLHLWFKPGDDPQLKKLGEEIIVECKNWRNPVGKPEINDLAGDMVSRKCKTGILISREGITGHGFKDAEGQRIIWFLSENNLIILVITFKDLESIGKGKNLVDLIKDKYSELVEGSHIKDLFA